VNNSTIREGTWLYDNKVPSKIIIEYRDISYGSGDYEDPEDIREDISGDFFYVIYYSPTELNRKLSEAGPFNSISEAESHCVKSTNGTITWHQ
jgi:hypothetical protein